AKHVEIICAVYPRAPDQIARRVRKVVMEGMSAWMKQHPASPLVQAETEFRVLAELVGRIEGPSFHHRIPAHAQVASDEMGITIGAPLLHAHLRKHEGLDAEISRERPLPSCRGIFKIAQHCPWLRGVRP